VRRPIGAVRPAAAARRRIWYQAPPAPQSFAGTVAEPATQPGKIGERSGQPVDLVDDYDVDPAGPDIVKQALQRGAFEIATGEPAIVIVVSRQYPALVPLAADEGFAGFALRGERIEFLLEPFLGGFAGVDRAAPAVRVSSQHRRPLRLNLVPARVSERRSGSAS